MWMMSEIGTQSNPFGVVQLTKEEEEEKKSFKNKSNVNLVNRRLTIIMIDEKQQYS